MSAFRPGCGFRVVGHVVRKFVVASGRCAFLVLAVPGERGERKHELRAFDDEIIIEIGALGVGMTVEALGTIENEALKDKARADVQVDGRACWVEKLTIRTLNVEGSSKVPEAPAAPASAAPKPGAHGDDDW